MRITSSLAALFVTAACATSAVAQDTEAEIIAKGKYIATAADCAACHGADFAGGDAIASPLGDIYASNITPEAATGIGAWNAQDFADALRRGRSPDKGFLYPAMPYTAYTGMTDADVAALFAYLQSVPAVENDVRETDLGFPFVRPAMAAWNLLFLDEGGPSGAIDVSGAEVERGRYLVETLGHCSACHSPRGALMQTDADRHLAGAAINGWYAPNITPDQSGIGSWSDAQLARFLKTGHNDIAVAGGEMGLAVEMSLSHLEDADIADMVAYLGAVPAVATAGSAPARTATPDVEVATIEAPYEGWEAIVAHDGTDGARLYQGACASCHGLAGTGTAGPNLSQNSDVRAPHPQNLVQVIAGGIDRIIDGQRMFMPGFGDQMSDAQIAAVASYVRSAFTDAPVADLDGQRVSLIRAGVTNTSWLISNAAALAWVAIAVAALLIVGLTGWAMRRRKMR